MCNVWGLILNKAGIWVYDAHPEPYKVKDKFAAIGSGAQAALAAMYLEQSPKNAVRIAAKVDPLTGGRINEKVL